MKIVWTNLITMWLTQIVVCEFLLAMGFGPTTSGVISGLAVGASFGFCGVPILTEKDETNK